MGVRDLMEANLNGEDAAWRKPPFAIPSSRQSNYNRNDLEGILGDRPKRRRVYSGPLGRI